MNKTILMVLLAAALGAYVWFYEIEGEEQRKAEQELEEKVIAVNKDSIQTLIVNDFETTYRFEKKEGKWKITSPVNTDADESTVNSYLTSLTDAKKSRPFSAKGNEKGTFGLLNPGLSVKVLGLNGNSDSVQFGDKTSIDEDMYISGSTTDSIIAITPISLKSASQKPLLTWRDKKAIHFDKNSISSFNLKSGNNYFSFKKNGNNWNLTQPISAKADKSTVDAILNKLDFGNVNSLEAETSTNLSKYKLSNPAYKIELFKIGESAKTSLSISSLKENQSFGKDEARSHIFTVDSNFVKVFDKSLYDLRDKDLINFNSGAITRINLLFENSILTFSKDTTDTWNIISGEAIDGDKIDDLVEAVQDMKVDRFVAEKPSYLSPYGLATPRGSLELFADSSKEVELEFGSEKNGQRFIRNTRSGQVIAVKSSSLEKVLISLDDIIDESVINDALIQDGQE